MILCSGVPLGGVQGETFLVLGVQTRVVDVTIMCQTNVLLLILSGSTKYILFDDSCFLWLYFLEYFFSVLAFQTTCALLESKVDFWLTLWLALEVKKIY